MKHIKFFNKPLLRILTIAAAIIVFACVVYRFSLHHQFFSWYLANFISQEQQSNSIQLHNYRVVIEAQPIQGIDQASGLTYNYDNNHLFLINDAPQKIIELNADGKVLREINLTGFEDTEAISYLGNNQFAVVEEGKYRITVVTIKNDTKVISKQSNFKTVAVDIYPVSMDGFEGLAYDAEEKSFLVAKEGLPLVAHQVYGLMSNNVNNINISVSKNIDISWLWLRDVSDLHYIQDSNNYLILSDESRRAIEVTKQGEVVGSLSLAKGLSGLLQRVPQAEGITLDSENNLYVVSEPNLFYKFSK